MRTISFQLIFFFGTLSLQASENVSCKSPDGMFALYQQNADKQPYYGSSAIIDAHTHQVVFQLESDRPPSSATKLLWTADSQHVAYFKAEMHKRATRVFARNGSAFSEIELPPLPSPTLPDKGDSTAETTQRVEPLRWLPSGDLLLENESQNPAFGRAAVEITLGFDPDGRALVRSTQQEKPSIVDYFLLLPPDIFEGPPAIWLRHIRDGGGLIDKANGYMRCEGDGAQPNFDVALFRHRDGRPLLVLCEGELEGDDAGSLQFFELGADGKMHAIRRSIFPISDGDSGARPRKDNWRFDLPREGKTILVRARVGSRILHKVTWNGDKFQEETTR